MLSSDTPLSPLPRLQDYDIDPHNGFLPATPPLSRLPDSYYQPWEDIINNFNSLLLIGKIRERVLKLPLLEVDRLQTLKEYQRAYTILGFITHAYIWGKNEPVKEVLPACIAVPFCKISDYLGLPPVITYASSTMWNWHLLDPNEPISVDNIVMTYTYSGSTDEMWFYLISVQIEHFGGKALDNMIKAIQAAQNWDLEGLSKNLAAIADAISNINKTLIKMHEKCDPYVFYWKVRPYLAGWENMQNAGLPHGIIYEGVDCPTPVTNPEEVPPSKYRQYAGGSAGQSSLIQALDVFLGVNHYPTSSEWREWKKNPELYNPSKHVNYLMKIRDYMPNLHRQFLYDLKAAFDIRAFIEELKNNDASPIAQEVFDNYNLAVGNIKEFRDKHISIVTRFIILPAKKGPFLGSYNVGVTAEQPPAPEQIKASQESIQKSLLQNNTCAKASTSTEAQSGVLQSRSATGGDILYPQRTPHTLESTIQRINQLEIKKKVDSNHGIAKQVVDDDVVRGTGGTDLIPFLKQARDETVETQLS